ncbi:MAG: DsbA family protein [Patulibacter sp.]
MPLDATFYIDPTCPFGYNATPDLTALRWRYGSDLRWRIVVIGLSEDTGEPRPSSGFTPTMAAQFSAKLSARFGMPASVAPRDRHATSGRACRAIVAVRRTQPELDFAALRALQFAVFCVGAQADRDEDIRDALAHVPGLDVDTVMHQLDDSENEAAYQHDKAEARTAAGSPTDAQGKAGKDGDVVRYSAPSIQLANADGRMLEAGGFQSLAAYDVLVANLDPTLRKAEVPEDLRELLVTFDHGLTTQEVAMIIAPSLGEPDIDDARSRLLALAGEGRASREPLGGDGLWRAA